MLLYFCYVVSDIINYRHPQGFGILFEHFLERLPNLENYHLSVCESHVCSACHGLIIIFSFFRRKWSTRQLWIWNLDPVFSHRRNETAKIICGNLMSETSRTAMYHDNSLVFQIYSEFLCDFLVINYIF